MSMNKKERNEKDDRGEGKEGDESEEEKRKRKMEKREKEKMRRSIDQSQLARETRCGLNFTGNLLIITTELYYCICDMQSNL